MINHPFLYFICISIISFISTKLF